MNLAFPDGGGSYILVFSMEESVDMKTRGKSFFIPENVYAYVGSAFGAGGLNRRLLRHFKREKKRHWHLDYLSTSRFFVPLAVYCFIGKRIECKLAKRFADSFPFIKRFGCSDCSCSSHLFIVNSVEEVDKIVSDLKFIAFKLRG
ncbi:GIY-YIG nuclease family protein [Desulfurobacterium sp.]